MEQFDILIIGGGPGGYSTAIAAGKQGLRVALFEKQALGGTCLNVGCIPTKYLIDKAKAMEKVRALVQQNIFHDAGFFSFRKIQEGKDQVTHKLVRGVAYLLKKSGVTYVQGEATLGANHIVTCNMERYQGKAVIIATGSVPMTIPIPGHEYCIDSTGALALKQLPEKMVVIGGGVIGLELACAFASYGTEIDIVEMLPKLLPREMPEAVQIMEGALRKRGIRIHTDAKMLRIEKSASGLQAVLKETGHEAIIDCQQVLMAAGRCSNLCGIPYDELGLELDAKKCIVVDQNQQTNLPGVYAIGDVAGGLQLAHVAYAEGEVALAHILGQTHKKALATPSCIYTDPCFASVGMTPASVKEIGLDPTVGSFDYSANGMALAEGASGRVFVVMDRSSQKTLGVTIVGENASEMIAFGASAVENGTTLDQWKSMIVAHPTLCEMIREAALDAFGMATHK